MDSLITLKDDLESIVEFNRLRKNVSNLGLKSGINQLIDISNETKLKVSDIFEYLYVKNQIRESSIDKLLNKFSGQAINVCKNQFCEIDENFIENTSTYIDQYLHRSSVKRADPIGGSRSPKKLQGGGVLPY